LVVYLPILLRNENHDDKIWEVTMKDMHTKIRKQESG
jgi:hypothetical protein